MSNEIKEKEEYEKYARDHRKELDAQEVRLGDVVTVLVGHFAGEKGVIVGMIACDKSDYADPYYEIEMECDVPEEFRVRKTLVGQSHVIGGVEKRHLKIIGNLAPKQQTNEIKVGDKVRVREDAPRVYTRGLWEVFEKRDSNVDSVEDGTAVISTGPHIIAIPLKYLVKVDAEKKEPEYKYQVGQKVKSAYANEILTIKERCGRVGHDNVYKVEEYAYTWNECELQPCTEPTEQTETEKKPNIGSITIPVEVDLSDSYWDAYTADLAKEVALKVANKYTDPKEAAEYAISVAKAVVDGLKRK